jgi:PAS domain-containing protein
LLGGQRFPNQLGRPSPADRRLFQALIEDTTDAVLVIDPRPGMHIMDMTRSFEEVTLSKRESICGEDLFKAFPYNPECPDTDGVSNVFNALRTAAETGVSQALKVQRYDVRNAEGQFVERYWRPLYIPLLDEGGDLAWLIARLEDVTAQYQG